ncbi:hypothetical protein CRUP_027938 [Coryphaenoides rupestris]|nr:hypothetical protein CRUP_027938 [Coryphaenoides rupestris]
MFLTVAADLLISTAMSPPELPNPRTSTLCPLKKLGYGLNTFRYFTNLANSQEVQKLSEEVGEGGGVADVDVVQHGPAHHGVEEVDRQQLEEDVDEASVVLHVQGQAIVRHLADHPGPTPNASHDENRRHFISRYEQGNITRLALTCALNS